MSKESEKSVVMSDATGFAVGVVAVVAESPSASDGSRGGCPIWPTVCPLLGAAVATVSLLGVMRGADENVTFYLYKRQANAQRKNAPPASNRHRVR